MTSVEDHYSTHLAPIYAWSVGGVDAAFARGEQEIAALLPDLRAGASAVDLGAGFGMHTVPLGRRGCSVLALDSSSSLLEELRAHAAGLPVTTAVDDLAAFPRHLGGPVDAILAMGDTLAHLRDPASVRTVIGLAAPALRRGGRFVASFRDYTVALAGVARFIPVRSDANRILTCFLEYGADHVQVHDVLHERTGAAWEMRVSAYRKLRLDPQWVCAELRSLGFTVRLEAGLAGMVRVVAAMP